MGLLDPPALSKAEAADRYATRTAARPLIPGPVVAGHSFNFNGSQTDAGMFSRTKHYVLYSATDLRFVFGNYFIGVGDQPNANNVTVKASMEYPAGTYFPLNFHGQDSTGTVTIRPGQFVISDPVPIDVVAGQALWVNTNIAPTASGSYPVGNSAGNTGSLSGEWRIAPTTTDNTASLPASGNGPGAFYGPHAVTGLPTGVALGKRTPQVFLWGDSIMNGSGDTAFATWGLVENGWARQGLNNTVPYVFAARSSTKAADFTSNTGRRFTASLIAGCTHAIEGFGANDFGNSRTLAQLQADRLTLWTTLANRGLKVHATTVTPRTTSTDSWATTANQTKQTWESSRTTFNDWLRAGAPISAGVAVAVGTSGATLMGSAGHPLTGVIDTADAAETARNSGFWKVNGSANYGTADGLHPSATIHALMAATVPVSKFVVS